MHSITFTQYTHAPGVGSAAACGGDAGDVGEVVDGGVGGVAPRHSGRVHVVTDVTVL